MFTNWLTPPNAPPPDILLELGPPPCIRFAAHSQLLTVHSGYLRSVILRPDDLIAMEQPIYIPNVTPEQFAPLLTYMYTGFLDLSIENIFGVLLATHVLHMPRALELCRSFLSRTQSDGYLSGGGCFQSTVNSTKIIRPIPSKPSGSGIGFIAPPISNLLLPSRDTTFKSLATPKIIIEREQYSSPIPSTSKSKSPLTKTIKIHKLKVPLPEKIKLHELTTPTPSIITIQEILEKETIDSTKTIIDVASCDGPVRFRRVLNDAYGAQQQQHSTQAVPQPPPPPLQERTQHNMNISFHQQMARNIIERRTISEESENSEDANLNQTSGGGGGQSNNSRSEEIYNCAYCKHTFKSQYCYQKHAKRHLNPLHLEGGGEIEIEEKEREIDVKREVKPLDMNVQYYPCKTCGSKFPSYYFVHKHRKLCHANEEN